MSAPATTAPSGLSAFVPRDMTTAQKVTAVAAVLILLQLVFRTWAAMGGWFYVDDFKFLSASREQPLSLDAILTPHDNKLMPGGLAIAWIVAQVGPFAWSAAAVSLVAMQALASYAAWFALRTLFGARWGVIPLLAIYLFAPITLTAFMWWGAAINLIPVQIGMFFAVGAHVKYLSTGKYRYALAAAAAVVLAMAFYQKALLIYPVLALLSVAYFGQGGVIRRTLAVLRTWWKGWLTYAAVLAGYLAYTFINVPSPVSTEGAIDYVGVIRTLSLETFTTTAVGGPWRWSTAVQPAAQIDPPIAVLIFSLSVFAAAIVWSIVRRRNAWPAWALLVGFVLFDGFLLATGRGSTAGVLAAVEARYVSDAAPVLVLALGLAFLPLASSRANSSSPRTRARPASRFTQPLVIAVGVTMAILTVVSSTRYVQFWHDDFEARAFVDTALAEAADSGSLEILNAEVPPEVLLPGLIPYTLPAVFFNGNDNVQAVESGTNVSVLDVEGQARIPEVFDGVASPSPKANSCGTLYSTDDEKFRREDGIELDLSGPAASFGTWVSFGYLSTSDGRVTLTLGDREKSIPLVRGANTYFFRPESNKYTSVLITDLSQSTTLCVSQIKIGHLKASRFS